LGVQFIAYRDKKLSVSFVRFRAPLHTNQHYEIQNRAILNFVSRLHYCHFMQKFEDECRMEFENVNRPMILWLNKNETYIKAWQEGKQAYNIDACMRCLVATRLYNFRMRAMVVSLHI
jgi:deoxyribodipyrimidine photo-lyase